MFVSNQRWKRRAKSLCAKKWKKKNKLNKDTKHVSGMPEGWSGMLEGWNWTHTAFFLSMKLCHAIKPIYITFFLIFSSFPFLYFGLEAFTSTFASFAFNSCIWDIDVYMYASRGAPTLRKLLPEIILIHTSAIYIWKRLLKICLNSNIIRAVSFLLCSFQLKISQKNKSWHAN